jgi:hypothetical protein
MAHKADLDVLENRKISCPCQDSSHGQKDPSGVHIPFLLVGKIKVNSKFIRTWTELSVAYLKLVFCLHLEKRKKTRNYLDCDVE